MLMPQELKKHNFEHVLRGYSTSEVDEYIEFICSQYEELYKKNADLERKLVAALRLVDGSMKRPAADANGQADQAELILQQAEQQRKRIVSDAEEYADRIIADADAHIAKQAQVLDQMKQSVLAFRDDLYARYSQQIDQLEEMAAAAMQDSGITVAAPVRSPLPAAVAIPAAEDAEEVEEVEEELLIFPRDTDTAEEADEVDEEELAATDAALAFFEETPAPEKEEAADGTPAEEELLLIGEEENEISEADQDVLSFFSDIPAEEDAPIEELLLVYGEDDDPAPAETSDNGGDDGEDEYGDAVIEGGEPIGDDEDPLEGFDERIAELLGTVSDKAEKNTVEEDSEEDDFSEEFLQIVEDDETPDKSEETEDSELFVDEESDDQLLRELRQAFHLQLETFEQENSSEKQDDFEFLPEEEEKEGKPASFLERLTGRSSENKKER